MPDTSGVLVLVPAVALVAPKIDDWLKTLGGGVRLLTKKEVDGYPDHSFVLGWRVPVEVGGKTLLLDLLLPAGFPWQPPRVGLAEPPPFLTWPHVEIDALLCLAPNTLTVDADDPIGVITMTLQWARDLVSHLTSENYEGAFRSEFLTYWRFAAHERRASFTSLLDPAPPTRAVYMWHGVNGYILGDTPEQLRRWLKNRFGERNGGDVLKEAALVWLDRPLVPSEYPSSGRDLRALVHRAPGGTQLLWKIARSAPDSIVTLLGFETDDGPAIAGTVLTAPEVNKHGPRQPLIKGFRPGKAPDTILATRYFGGGNLKRCVVDRADAAWIHGRGHDRRSTALQTMSATVMGCGSVGGPIAISLGQSGLGRLVLVDFDALSWANVGRHPLGAEAVGHNKAKALAEKLHRNFPHLQVEYFPVDVDTMVRKHTDVLESSAILISATGSWAGDGRLEAWRAEAQSRVPVIHTWTEAHACAGHAVFLKDTGGCLRCGFDRTGVPKFQITSWPKGSLRSEPACGGVYQPYGPVELGFINGMSAELALDVLLAETATTIHRVWVAPVKRVQQLGGLWTSSWQTEASFRNEGSLMFERPWPSAACPRCAKLLAA
jgi:molybdopterin/thiamine biosynthesis adenylyltransferase